MDKNSLNGDSIKDKFVSIKNPVGTNVQSEQIKSIIQKLLPSPYPTGDTLKKDLLALLGKRV